MRALALAVLALGGVLAAGQSRAQTYDPAFPVCMYVVNWGGGGYYDCKYYSMAQCNAIASGRGGTQCGLNPYYAGGKASRPRGRQ